MVTRSTLLPSPARTSSRDSSFLLQPSLRWSQRTAGLSRAATISAATKGANRDSRGGPSLATSTTAAAASTRRMISRSHNCPRSCQDSCSLSTTTTPSQYHIDTFSFP